MEIKIIMLVLAALVGAYRIVLGVVQYRSANNPTPANVADVFDSETYTKWKKYSAENCRLDIISSVVSCIVTLSLLASNTYAGFAALFPKGIFAQLFAVVLLETLVDTFFSVIWSYISTMKIEEKYGFNRTTAKTFVIDCIRNTLISFGMSLGLVCLLSFLHLSMGNWMILLFAVVVFVFILLVSFLYPILSRIGNKFVPLEEGELKDKLMELLTKHGYTVKAIEVMDASRRTTKLNAYFTGFGKMKTIVLYDNLVNAMSTEEICAVFAHELGHGLNKDVLKQQTMNFGSIFIMAVLVWVAVISPVFHTQFGFDEVNYGFAYIIIGIWLGIVNPFIGILTNAYSRFAEYRADAQAVKENYGLALVTALKKLAKENFAHLSPAPLNVIMEYSHPPLSARIERIEQECAKMQ